MGKGVHQEWVRSTSGVGQEYIRSGTGVHQEWARSGQEDAKSGPGVQQDLARSAPGEEKGSVGALSGAYKADEVGRKPKSLIMILLNMLIRHIVMGSDVFKGVFVYRLRGLKDASKTLSGQLSHNICTKARFASKPHSDAPETPLLAHATVGRIVNLETLTCATRAGKLVPPPASTAPGRNPRCSKAPPQDTSRRPRGAPRRIQVASCFLNLMTCRHCGFACFFTSQTSRNHYVLPQLRNPSTT